MDTWRAPRSCFCGATPSDEYVVKVPTLRNIALTALYFHTGQVWDLRQAVVIMGASQLGIQLTDDEVGKITASRHYRTTDATRRAFRRLVAPQRSRVPCRGRSSWLRNRRPGRSQRRPECRVRRNSLRQAQAAPRRATAICTPASQRPVVESASKAHLAAELAQPT